MWWAAPRPGSAAVWLGSPLLSLGSLSPCGPEAPVQASAGPPALWGLWTHDLICGLWGARAATAVHHAAQGASLGGGLLERWGGGLQTCFWGGGLDNSLFPQVLPPSSRLSPEAVNVQLLISLSTSISLPRFPLLSAGSTCITVPPPQSHCVLSAMEKLWSEPSKAWVLESGGTQESGLLRPKYTCMLYSLIIPVSVS